MMIHFASHPMLDAFQVGYEASRMVGRTNRYEFRGYRRCMLLIQSVEVGMTVNGVYRIFGAIQLGLWPEERREDFDSYSWDIFSRSDSLPVGGHWQSCSLS